jgi:hypothetical protein
VAVTSTLRNLIGREVQVDRCDGIHERGRLLDINRRSMWLVTGSDEDRFIAWTDVADVRAAS